MASQSSDATGEMRQAADQTVLWSCPNYHHQADTVIILSFTTKWTLSLIKVMAVSERDNTCRINEEHMRLRFLFLYFIFRN